MSIRNEIHVIAPGGGNPTNLVGRLHMDSGVVLVGYVTGLGTISFDITEPGNGANLHVSCDGSKESDVRVVTGVYDGSLLIRDLPVQLEPSVLPFPPSDYINNGSFLPFDSNDPGGDVHTVLPPEYRVPVGRDIDYWRGDIGGVTTPLTPPLVPGGNTTPANMWMSFLLQRYTVDWQNYYLDQYYRRGYTHFVHTRRETYFAPFANMVGRIRAAGQFFCYWDDDRAHIQENVEAGLVDVMILGGELNSHHSPEDLQALIDWTCALCNPRNIPVYIHFTANVPSWQPNDSNPVLWWHNLVGRVKGLCWQGDQDNPAGLMGAHLWDARKYLGSAGGYNLSVVAFELLATNQLYGKASETDGRRRGWELNCCTRDDHDYIPPVSGYGNGGSRPDGSLL